MKKNLVILRSGDKSLHPQWLDNKFPRNWDLAISYYGNKDKPYDGEYEFFHQFKGSKWEGIADFCANNGDIISKYDYIWLPDDDLLTTCENINSFFDICNDEQFNLAQPALENSSYFSHRITLQHPLTYYRMTNFVEVMAPCFSRALFNKITNTFKLNTSGWGLEWVWLDIASKNDLKNIAIIDKTPILHTRPVSSAGSGGAKRSPAEEMKDMLLHQGIKTSDIKNLSFKPSRFSLTHIISSLLLYVTRFMLKFYKTK
jgi:Protein of unknown function (DUF707)